MENGNIIKCKRNADITNDSIWAGGGGGFVDIRTWDNELLYQFEQNDALYRLHHDIELMPNGNILLVLWEYHSAEDAIENGRDPASIPQGKIWPDAVWELDPNADTIVWKWSAWDHLVQDFDATKENFGAISDHPERIDVNYDQRIGNPDWMHVNGIDYNPVLDQIALSVPHFDEIWIIDHSTTTEEAASHSGGNFGKGGDLLYRYGNPRAYQQGSEDDQCLFFQHHIQWVDPNAQLGDPEFGKLIFYNNRVSPLLSPAPVFQSLRQGTMDYLFEDGRFGPNTFERTYFHPDSLEIASSNGLSSVQVLPNGNVLILSGRWGFAYEMDENDEIVWEYRIPLSAGIPIEQGAQLRVNDNLTFRMERFSLDFPAFEGRDMTPGEVLELNPLPQACAIVVNTEEVLTSNQAIEVFPNPNFGNFTLNFTDWQGKQLSVFSLSGSLLQQFEMQGPQMDLNLSYLQKGMYLLQIDNYYQKIVIQ